MSRLRLVEYGRPVPLVAPGLDVAAIRDTSRRLRRDLKLRGEPFELTSDGTPRIRSRYVAGFASLGDVSIEIAPKFMADGSGERWKDAFLAVLLRVSRLQALPRIHAGASDVALPDLLGLILVDGLTAATHEGLPRRYVEERANLPFVRGRIDASQTWRRLTDPGTVPCRFDVLTEDTAASRLILWAAASLQGAVTSSWLANELAALLEHWSSVPRELPQPRDRDLIRLPLQFDFLSESVEVARLLAEGSTVTLDSSGHDPGRAFLWNTETLFESFARTVVGFAARRRGLTVAKRRMSLARHYLPRSAEDSRGPVTTEPDILVLSGARPVALLDAKYKTLRDHPSSSYAYQVIAGGRLIGADDVALIYPTTRNFETNDAWRVRSEGKPRLLHALPMDLLSMADRDGFAKIVAQFEHYLDRILTARKVG